MGVGFCVVAPKNEVNKIMSICKKHRLVSYEIGRISEKVGVFLNDKKLA
jgi:phosphoribosylformylglycinamidine cyclo-ligase